MIPKGKIQPESKESSKTKDNSTHGKNSSQNLLDLSWQQIFWVGVFCLCSGMLAGIFLNLQEERLPQTEKKQHVETKNQVKNPQNTPKTGRTIEGFL